MIIDKATLRNADQIVARHIRDARETAGISVAEAAEAAGVNVRDLGAWEAGTKSADVVVTLALLEWYGADGESMLREIDKVIEPFRRRI